MWGALEGREARGRYGSHWGVLGTEMVTRSVVLLAEGRCMSLQLAATVRVGLRMRRTLSLRVRGRTGEGGTEGGGWVGGKEMKSECVSEKERERGREEGGRASDKKQD